MVFGCRRPGPTILENRISFRHFTLAKNIFSQKRKHNDGKRRIADCCRLKNKQIYSGRIGSKFQKIKRLLFHINNVNEKKLNGFFDAYFSCSFIIYLCAHMWTCGYLVIKAGIFQWNGYKYMDDENHPFGLTHCNT